MATLERAISLAAQAHEGQVDKAGAPYILHPLRMMLSVDTPDARMAAVLHDVVEDTPITLDQLRGEGFPETVIEAVEALTNCATTAMYLVSPNRPKGSEANREVPPSDSTFGEPGPLLCAPASRSHRATMLGLCTARGR